MEAVSNSKVSGALAAILKQERARFNARFHAAKAGAPHLDGAAFGAHLSTHVAPLVEAVHAFNPQRSFAVAESLYQLSLTLFAKNLLGAQSRVPAMSQIWRELFPHVISLLAREPERVAALCNAVHQLHQTPGAKADQWIVEMKALAALNDNDGDDYLRAGQIIAWRCGLAHFRQSALEACATLAAKNEPLARAALGVREMSTPFADILNAARQSAWWTPENDKRELRIVKTIGAFLGFASDNDRVGAVFVSLPRVVFHGGNFFAADTENCWQVFADAFGASFHRAGKTSALPRDESTLALRLLPDGTLQSANESAHFPQLSDASSRAGDASTLAVTLLHSHAIFFIAA